MVLVLFYCFTRAQLLDRSGGQPDVSPNKLPIKDVEIMHPALPNGEHKKKRETCMNERIEANLERKYSGGAFLNSARLSGAKYKRRYGSLSVLTQPVTSDEWFVLLCVWFGVREPKKNIFVHGVSVR